MNWPAFRRGLMEGLSLPVVWFCWALAWSLYWMGDLASRVEDWPGGYRTYQWLMCRSMAVQEWANLSGPWKDHTP